MTLFFCSGAFSLKQSSLLFGLNNELLMEDTVSRTSCDSAADEFVVVSVEPKLQIAGNGGYCELERKLTEVLSDDGSVVNCAGGFSKMADTKGNVLSNGSTAEAAGKSILQHPLQSVAEEVVSSANDAKSLDPFTSFGNVNTIANKPDGGVLIVYILYVVSVSFSKIVFYRKMCAN